MTSYMHSNDGKRPSNNLQGHFSSYKFVHCDLENSAYGTTCHAFNGKIGCNINFTKRSTLSPRSVWYWYGIVGFNVPIDTL